jgi:hypothetical protein
LNPLVYARSFANCEKAVAFVNQLIDLFIVFPISDTKRAFLLETMLEGTIAANWSTNTPQADVRIARLIKAMMRMPEYQLN